MKKMIAACAVASVLVLAGCGGDATTESNESAAPAPKIEAKTDKQMELALTSPPQPTIDLPEVDSSWGDNLAGDYVDALGGPDYLEFTPDHYDYDSPQFPTLMGVWVLNESVGDGRNDAVFVAAEMRPHDFVHADNERVQWGDALVSAAQGLREEALLGPDDVAQSKRVDVAGQEAWLLTGYAEEGPNRDYNFAYVTFDDGAFFYTFRLAGDPDYFDDYLDDFMTMVNGVRFKAR